MKTSIDIPDPLYRRAKIRAVEEGATMKDLIVRSLSNALGPDTVLEDRPAYATRRTTIRASANCYTAVIKQEGKWWIGWIQELPGVNCQERTRARLLDTLRITLAEAIDLNRQEALAAASSGYEEERVAL